MVKKYKIELQTRFGDKPITFSYADDKDCKWLKQQFKKQTRVVIEYSDGFLAVDFGEVMALKITKA